MSHAIILNFNRFAERLVPRIDFEEAEKTEKEQENGRRNNLQISVDETKEKEEKS